MNALVKIIEDEGWAEAVDLVHGGHTSIVMTDANYAKSKADFEAARVAGVPLDSVTWYTAAQMHEVSASTILQLAQADVYLDIWHTLSSLHLRCLQPLAAQVRDPAFRACEEDLASLVGILGTSH